MNLPDPDQERQWIAGARRGDQAAWLRLIEAYRAYLYHVAWKVLLHEEDALDAAQEALIALVSKLDGFRGESSFRTWLTAIVVRKALDLRRGRRYEVHIEDLAGPLEIAASGPDVRDVIDRERRISRIERAMGCLSPQQRAIFLLRSKEQLPPREIARQLELSPAVVRIQLFRALEKIREQVKDSAVGEQGHG